MIERFEALDRKPTKGLPMIRGIEPVYRAIEILQERARYLGMQSDLAWFLQTPEMENAHMEQRRAYSHAVAILEDAIGEMERKLAYLRQQDWRHRVDREGLHEGYHRLSLRSVKRRLAYFMKACAQGKAGDRPCHICNISSATCKTRLYNTQKGIPTVCCEGVWSFFNSAIRGTEVFDERLA